jgi:hypothetical protein
MLKMSRERVEKLAGDLVEAMAKSKTVVFLKSRDSVHQAIALSLAEEFKREEEREEIVRKRISALRKAPSRRSPEWEVLFRKLMEEEYVREGVEG